MNEKTRREKQADAILGGLPLIAGREVDMRPVGKLLMLERMGNKYFGGPSGQGDIEAMTQVFFVATRNKEEMLTFENIDESLNEFACAITMDDVNEFGRYFERVLEEINASSAEPTTTPGKRKAARRRTGQRKSSASRSA